MAGPTPASPGGPRRPRPGNGQHERTPPGERAARTAGSRGGRRCADPGEGPLGAGCSRLAGEIRGASGGAGPGRGRLGRFGSGERGKRRRRDREQRTQNSARSLVIGSGPVSLRAGCRRRGASRREGLGTQLSRFTPPHRSSATTGALSAAHRRHGMADRPAAPAGGALRARRRLCPGAVFPQGPSARGLAAAHHRLPLPVALPSRELGAVLRGSPRRVVRRSGHRH